MHKLLIFKYGLILSTKIPFVSAKYSPIYQFIIKFIILKVFSIQKREIKSYVKVANEVEEQRLVRESQKAKSVFQPQGSSMDTEECQLALEFIPD